MEIIHGERYGDMIVRCSREDLEVVMQVFRKLPYQHDDDKVRVSLQVEGDHILYFETDKWW